MHEIMICQQRCLRDPCYVVLQMQWVLPPLFHLCSLHELHCCPNDCLGVMFSWRSSGCSRRSSTTRKSTLKISWKLSRSAGPLAPTHDTVTCHV